MPTPVADVAHLLRRAEFGGSTARINQLAALDRTALVDKVLDTTGQPVDTYPAGIGNGTSQWQQGEVLRDWWLTRMITTPTPIVEKMTLFWHGHFVTSQDKVQSADFMFRQIKFLRQYGMGGLKALTQGVAIQPAMLTYLDNDGNAKGYPNINWARELMELFTIGVGNYTEADIKASARAWTGHWIDHGWNVYKFNFYQHDFTNKTFFGVTKPWDGPEIIDFLLTDPAPRLNAAKLIVRKMWTFFVYENPSDALVTALANQFIAGGLNIKLLLRAIFLHPEFWGPAARSALVRSPVEYVVSLHRRTGLTIADTNPQWYLQNMGQDLLYPPDVSGWKANGYWISTSTMSARAEFASHLANVLNSKGKLAGWPIAWTYTVIPMVLEMAGIPDATTNTRNVLINYLNAQKPLNTWPVRPGLATLAFLSPECQVA